MTKTEKIAAIVAGVKALNSEIRTLFAGINDNHPLFETHLSNCSCLEVYYSDFSCINFVNDLTKLAADTDCRLLIDTCFWCGHDDAPCLTFCL